MQRCCSTLGRSLGVQSPGVLWKGGEMLSGTKMLCRGTELILKVLGGFGEVNGCFGKVLE